MPIHLSEKCRETTPTENRGQAARYNKTPIERQEASGGLGGRNAQIDISNPKSKDLVTVDGVPVFEKWSRKDFALKGLFLRVRDDLLLYLDRYKITLTVYGAKLLY